MEIRYSDHLRARLRFRTIPENLPRKIYLRSRRRYFDVQTGVFIAITRGMLFGKRRDIMVAYRHENHDIVLITIHPLKAQQLNRRLSSGRWKEIKKA